MGSAVHAARKVSKIMLLMRLKRSTMFDALASIEWVFNVRLPRPLHLRPVFEEIRDRITTGGKPLQLENSRSVTSMISSMHANMQNDLPTPHARRLAAGEKKLERLLQILTR
jgi:hypothetical protein